MIAIVQYNAGNVLSVANALGRLGYDYLVTDDALQLRQADKVVLPGVGAAGMAMAYLRDRGLDEVITRLEQPVLGICLGLQLMCRYSEEDDTQCLGIFDTVVGKLPPTEPVPHMGWNNLKQTTGPLFAGIANVDDVYFVHSYAAGLCADTIAVCDYTRSFSAALCRKNFYATQFHPEKSAGIGQQILKNFLEL